MSPSDDRIGDGYAYFWEGVENGGAIYLGFVSLWSHWKAEVVENIFISGKRLRTSWMKLLEVVATKIQLQKMLVDTAELSKLSDTRDVIRARGLADHLTSVEQSIGLTVSLIETQEAHRRRQSGSYDLLWLI